MGYMAGVMVGGLFLAADALRRKFGRRDDASPDPTSFDSID
jgi:hypothetical protein